MESYISGTGDCLELPGGEIVETLARLSDRSEARIFLARQVSLNRLVAMKILPLGARSERLLAILEHEHIVRVYSETVDVRKGHRVVCMQYVAGADLSKISLALSARCRDRLKGGDLLDIVDSFVTHAPLFQGALARERAEFALLGFDQAVARLGRQLASALHHAHAHGMVHLNVKPQNVLVSPYGRAYLSDFGFLTKRPTDDDRAADLNALKGLLGELLRRHEPPAPLAKPRYFELGLEKIFEVSGSAGSAKELKHQLDGYDELQRIESSLPRPGPIIRFSLRWPLIALITFRLLPQLCGTTFGTLYCLLRRGVSLTEPERLELLRIVKTYNSISYPTSIALALLLACRLVRAYRQRARLPFLSAQGDAPVLRRRALRLPWQLAAINCLTWWPSILVFSGAAYLITGRFHLPGYLHFATAVLLSWLIATSYSTLYCLFFSIQVLYPRFLDPLPDIRITARRELSATAKVLKWFPAIVSLIPLSAALLLAQAGPGDFSPVRYLWFRGLLAFLIGAGGVGFVVSLVGLRRLERVIQALGGPGKEVR